MSEAVLSHTDVYKRFILQQCCQFYASMHILRKFFDDYNNTKIYSNQKFTHYIIRCSSSGLVHLGRRKCEHETD
jgi:tRNA splicing ligase